MFDYTWNTKTYLKFVWDETGQIGFVDIDDISYVIPDGELSVIYLKNGTAIKTADSAKTLWKNMGSKND